MENRGFCSIDTCRESRFGQKHLVNLVKAIIHIIIDRTPNDKKGYEKCDEKSDVVNFWIDEDGVKHYILEVIDEPTLKEN